MQYLFELKKYPAFPVNPTANSLAIGWHVFNIVSIYILSHLYALNLPAECIVIVKVQEDKCTFNFRTKVSDPTALCGKRSKLLEFP